MAIGRLEIVLSQQRNDYEISEIVQTISKFPVQILSLNVNHRTRADLKWVIIKCSGN